MLCELASEWLLEAEAAILAESEAVRWFMVETDNDSSSMFPSIAETVPLKNIKKNVRTGQGVDHIPFITYVGGSLTFLSLLTTVQ